MNEQYNRIGVYLSADKMQFTEICYIKNEFILNHLDEAYYPEKINFISDKETKIISLLKVTFDEILSRHQIHSSNAFVSLPASFFRILTLPVDSTLMHQDVLNELRWEFSVLYPDIDFSDYILQYFDRDVKDSSRNAIVLALKRKYIAIVEGFLIKNSIQLQGVDYAHFHADKALFLNYPSSKEGLVASFYLSDESLSFELLFGGIPEYLKIVHISNASVIPATIVNELKLISDYGYNPNLINSFVLQGDRITPSMIEGLKKQTGLSFQAINPFKKIPINPKLQNSRLLKERFFNFTASSGACYRLV